MKQNSILLVHDVFLNGDTSIKLATEQALEGVGHEIISLPYGYGLSIIKITEPRKETVTLTWTKSK
jgi:hypothetical protein